MHNFDFAKQRIFNHSLTPAKWLQFHPLKYNVASTCLFIYAFCLIQNVKRYHICPQKHVSDFFSNQEEYYANVEDLNNSPIRRLNLETEFENPLTCERCIHFFYIVHNVTMLFKKSGIFWWY